MLEKLKQVREQQGANLTNASGFQNLSDIESNAYSGRSTPKPPAEIFVDDTQLAVKNLLAMDRTNFLQIVNAIPVPDCAETFFDDEFLPEENFDPDAGKMFLEELIENSKTCPEDALPEPETTAASSSQPTTPRSQVTSTMTQVMLVKKIMGAKRLAAKYFAHVRAEIMEEVDEQESEAKRRRM